MFSLAPWKKRQSGSSPSTALTDPFENRLAQFQSEFNSLIDRFWHSRPGDLLGTWGWGCDLDETETEYVVRAEAPGFEAEDFDVQVRGNQLFISAEHREEQNGKRGSLYHYGRFERNFPLPYGAQTDNISARYHSGVLEIRLPKGEDAQGKRITVESA